VRCPRNNLQGNSPTFDIFSHWEQTQQRLKKWEFILKSDVFAAVVDAKAPYFRPTGKIVVAKHFVLKNYLNYFCSEITKFLFPSAVFLCVVFVFFSFCINL